MRKRAGIILIAGGLALAGLTMLLVIGIARQAAAAANAPLRQVAVVVATRESVDRTQLTADALAVKPFPADFAPAGAFSSLDDVVGKFAQGFIPKGQVVIGGQLQMAAPPGPNLSDRITPGMVVMWLPMPDVLASDNVLKPGDHVDVLLTAPINSGAAGEKQANTLSTQTTLQNVQIYRIGEDELNALPSNSRADSGASQSSGTNGFSSSTPASATGRRALGLLVGHQDAVTMKFVKDAGGTLDLVTRSADDQQVVPTDGVTLDSLTDRFRFRIPQPVQPTDSVKAQSR